MFATPKTILLDGVSLIYWPMSQQTANPLLWDIGANSPKQLDIDQHPELLQQTVARHTMSGDRTEKMYYYNKTGWKLGEYFSVKCLHIFKLSKCILMGLEPSSLPAALSEIQQACGGRKYDS